MKDEEKKESLKKEIVSWIFSLAFAFVAALLIVTFIGQRVSVDGQSMESTLQDRDNLICDKISYRISDPKRYDIVVIFPDDTKSKRWIKRIIGMPGETVRIDLDGNIYIDGEILEENYGREVIENPGLAIEEIQLGDDEYWCMGDNRNHSSDSRVIGPVPRNHIVGRAILRVYPFSKFGPINQKK